MIIYPENNIVNIEYKKTLNVKSSIKFDFKLFVIILILTFLLSYKLSDYVADFKSVKEKSRIEILFLTIFFIFLFIPMSNINQGDISKNENRTLAKWQHFITKDGEINYNFGKDFNEWFNDRFYLRDRFLASYNGILITLTGKSGKGYVDKNEFTYLSSEINHNYIDEISNDDYLALVKFDEFCKINNIDLYVLLVPDKGYVHPPSRQFSLNDVYYIKIDNKIKELNKNYGMHIINPLQEMQREAKNNYIFFKTEHHWTDDGAFVGYKELMKEINKKYKNINVLEEKDFVITTNTLVRGEWCREYGYGQNSWRLNLPKSLVKNLHKTDYRYYTHKDSRFLKTIIINSHHNLNKVYVYKNVSNYRVVQLGTSMNENLTEFIPYTFKNVKRIRNTGVKDMPRSEEFKIMKYYKNEILEYKPNIMIFCITYGNMSGLKNLFKE